MIPITQLGRIVRDVELVEVETQGEKNLVINNTLAIKINKENAVFIEFTAWGKVAENIHKYYKKGDEMLATGELRSKKRTIGEKEITSIFLLIKGYDFTYGNAEKQDNSDLPFTE